MNRHPWLITALGLVAMLVGLISVAWIVGKHASKASTSSPIDSSRVVLVHDTILRIDSVERVRLATKRERIHSNPLPQVIDSLPDDTADTSAPELVRPGVIRATADSLATCQFDRDSLTRANLLERARTASQDEARRLCEAKPAPIQPDPPSRLTWTAIGGVVSIAITTTLLILTR